MFVGFSAPVLAFFCVPVASLTTNHFARAGNDARGKSFAQMFCSDFEQPKQVAVCLHGSARSFPHSLVHQSMKENLFGGSFGAEMTPFLHVTRIDARGDPEGDQDVFPEWSVEQVLEAASILSIASEDIKILDGPDMPLPECKAFEHDFKKREKYEASGGTDHKNTLAYAKTLAGTLSHKKGCMDLITAKEERLGTKFDLVILARADLTFYQPLRPYCLYELGAGLRFWDWFFILPRDKADETVQTPYKSFYDCETPFEMGDTVEAYVRQGDFRVDLSLPVLVTRKPGARHSLCGIAFRPEHTSMDEKELGTLCHEHLVDENKYNSYQLK